jgi:hypothetical protein
MRPRNHRKISSVALHESNRLGKSSKEGLMNATVFHSPQLCFFEKTESSGDGNAFVSTRKDVIAESHFAVGKCNLDSAMLCLVFSIQELRDNSTE